MCQHNDATAHNPKNKPQRLDNLNSNLLLKPHVSVGFTLKCISPLDPVLRLLSWRESVDSQCDDKERSEDKHSQNDTPESIKRFL